MDRDLKVKHFANTLFSHVYRSYNSTYELPVRLPHTHNSAQNTEFSEDIGKAVVLFCSTFHADFTQLFIKAFADFQTSEKQYMEFLTSRCLKLCEDDVFLSFIITSAFIAELILFCCSNGCFSFMNTGPKCLIAIFNRRLKKEFYAHGGWEGLSLFCENLVHPNENVEDYISSLTEHIQGNLLNHLEESSDDTDEDEDSDEDEESETEDISLPIQEPTESGLIVLQPLPPMMEQSTADDEEDDDEEIETDDSDSSESDDSEVDMNVNTHEGGESSSSEESELSSISNNESSDDEADNT